MPLVLFNPQIGPYQVLPRQARVDLGAMAIKGYSVFSPSDWLVSYTENSLGVILPLCRGAVSEILQPQSTGQCRHGKNWLIRG